MGRITLLPPDDMPEVEVQPEPPPDPGLRRAIQECLAALKGKPLVALRARLDSVGVEPDRELARNVGMTLNTVLQNIVRARNSMAECLRRRGVVIEEALS